MLLSDAEDRFQRTNRFEKRVFCRDPNAMIYQVVVFIEYALPASELHRPILCRPKVRLIQKPQLSDSDGLSILCSSLCSDLCVLASESKPIKPFRD